MSTVAVVYFVTVGGGRRFRGIFLESYYMLLTILFIIVCDEKIISYIFMQVICFIIPTGFPGSVFRQLFCGGV